MFFCVSLSVPIIATAVQEELETGSVSAADAACATSTVKQTSFYQLAIPTSSEKVISNERCRVVSVVPPQAEKHHPALVKVLCSELAVEPEALLDFELCLTDTQPAVSLQIKALTSCHM